MVGSSINPYSFSFFAVKVNQQLIPIREAILSLSIEAPLFLCGFLRGLILCVRVSWNIEERLGPPTTTLVLLSVKCG